MDKKGVIEKITKILDDAENDHLYGDEYDYTLVDFDELKNKIIKLVKSLRGR